MPKSCPPYLTQRHFSKLVVWFSGGLHAENRCWMGAYLTDEQSDALCKRTSRKVFAEPTTIDAKLLVDAVETKDCPINKDVIGKSEQRSPSAIVQVYNEFIFINQVNQHTIICMQ